MRKGEKLVYVPMAADTIHPGHLNILQEAEKLGRVMVGLFTDEAIASYKKIPLMDYEKRKAVIESIKGVDCVVKQETRDYEPNLRKYKPDYMVHGTDWREGPLAEVRKKAIRVMEEWGGKVVEPEYTQGISSSQLHKQMNERGRNSQEKREYMKRLLSVRDFVTAAGVFGAQMAEAAEKSVVKSEDGVNRKIDILWLDIEGLARWKGMESAACLESANYVEILLEISINTQLPIIVPITSSALEPGNREKKLFQKLEQAGASAIALIGIQDEMLRTAISCYKEWRNDQNLTIWTEVRERSGEEIGYELMKYAEVGVDGLLYEYSGSIPFSSVPKVKGLPVLVSKKEGGALESEKLIDLGVRGLLIKNKIAQRMEHCAGVAIEQLLTDIY